VILSTPADVDLVVVGSVALDSVKSPAGSVVDALGGSAVYFSIAAGVLCKTGIVAVVGEDFPKEHRAMLAGRGVDLTGLTVESGKTFRWSGVYSDDFSERETLETYLNVFADFEPNIPGAYRGAGVLFLGNIQPQLQRHVLEQMDGAGVVVADTMNFWIDSDREAVLDVFGRCNGVMLNDEEARSLTGENNLIEAAEALLDSGPVFVVVKKGEHGCLLAQGGELFSLPSYPVRDVRDPTGAGDSFAGGFLGYLAQRGRADWETLKGAAAVGTAVASFGVQGFSVDALTRATAAKLSERISELLRMCSFAAPEL
jgi:sugar/nucleoside kinase (ribokinase family)